MNITMYPLRALAPMCAHVYKEDYSPLHYYPHRYIAHFFPLNSLKLTQPPSQLWRPCPPSSSLPWPFSWDPRPFWQTVLIFAKSASLWNLRIMLRHVPMVRSESALWIAPGTWSKLSLRCAAYVFSQNRVHVKVWLTCLYSPQHHVNSGKEDRIGACCI